MTTSIRQVLIVLLVTCAAMVTAQERSPRVLLEAARKAEVVDGDLRSAIEQYKAIAARFSSDRPVAADALIRLAACYQKLGDAEARTVYERVLREFADQKDAVAIARAEIGSQRSPSAPAVATVGDRAVWTGPDVDLFGTISPDGRFLSYTDWRTTNNTIVRDLAAGTERSLTHNVTFGEHGYSGWSAISRDGRQVAFEWAPHASGARQSDAPRRGSELRIAELAGSGAPASRLVRRFADGESVRPFDWSPDGSSIAVLIERRGDWSQIGMLSVRDGTVRSLKSIDWRAVEKMVFSPDGRYVAYDLATPGNAAAARILAVAVDGSQEHEIVADGAENHVMGWAADGRLIFASRRSGALSLWVVPVLNGRAAGTARLVKDNLASSWSLGLSSSGALYIWKYASMPYVKVAAIDFTTGTMEEATSGAFQQFVDSRGRPAWSSDGAHMIFVSCGAPGGGPCVLFHRATDTGVVRQIPHRLHYLGFPRISPGGRWVVSDGADDKGRQGLYLLDAATGTTTVVARGEARPRNPDWFRDGTAFSYLETRDGSTAVMKREVGSGQSTELLRIPLSETSGQLRLSPDGAMVGYIRDDLPGKRSQLVVRPVAGGETRPVLTGDYRTIRFHWVWTPRSDAVLVHKALPGEIDEMWLAPLVGTARKMNIDMRQWQNGGLFQVHPDGRHLAFVGTAGDPGAEVWALENFLPRQEASR